MSILVRNWQYNLFVDNLSLWNGAAKSRARNHLLTAIRALMDEARMDEEGVERPPEPEDRAVVQQ